MGLKKLHTVATAAVRDASNGPAFLKQIAALGLKPRLLSGRRGSRAVRARRHFGHPARQRHRRRPWRRQPRTDRRRARRRGRGGVASARRAARRAPSPIAASIAEGDPRRGRRAAGCKDAARGHGLYLVGGSFRALALLDLKTARPSAADRPPASHRAGAARRTARDLARTDRCDELKALHRTVGSSRIPTLPAAATILEAMVEVLGPSADRSFRPSGCAKGCSTATSTRRRGTRTRCSPARSRSASGSAGSAIMARRSTSGSTRCFPTKAPTCSGLRLAACLLGDIAWNAHPDFRAERAVDMAIHGNWVGIDAHGRAMLGRALCSAFGGDGGFSTQLAALAEARRGRARDRLGQGDPPRPAASAAGPRRCCARPSIALRDRAGRPDDSGSAIATLYLGRGRAAAGAAGQGARPRAGEVAFSLAAAGAFDPVGGVEIDRQPVGAKVHRHHHALGRPSACRARPIAASIRAPSSWRRRLADELARALRCGRLPTGSPVAGWLGRRRSCRRPSGKQRTERQGDAHRRSPIDCRAIKRSSGLTRFLN